jgi:hypothetical protein
MTERKVAVDDFRSAAGLIPNPIPVAVIYTALRIAERVMTPGAIKAALPSGWWDLSGKAVESAVRKALIENRDGQ